MDSEEDNQNKGFSPIRRMQSLQPSKSSNNNIN